MNLLQLSKANRLAIIIGISFSFFCAEIAGQLTMVFAKPGRRCAANSRVVGFYTRSLALVADAFHYVRARWRPASRLAKLLIVLQLNDLIGFVVGFVAFKVTLPSYRSCHICT